MPTNVKVHNMFHICRLKEQLSGSTDEVITVPRYLMVPGIWRILGVQNLDLMRFLVLCGAFLACSLFIYVDASAQYPVSPNLVDENGLRTGHWTILYDSNFYIVHDPDSVVFYRLIRFEAGKPVGKIRDFWKTGNKYWDGFAILEDGQQILGRLCEEH